MTEYIYTLINRITGGVYVGKTNNPDRRYYHHINMLEKGASHHPKLQRDFDIYGNVYDFEIVDKQLKSDNIDREMLWIDKVDYRKSLNIQKKIGHAWRANKRLKVIRADMATREINLG